MKRSFVPWSVIVIASTSFVPAAIAESPALVPVRGSLSDANGTPIDGSRDLGFVVYDAESGGNAVYTASFAAHPVVAGDFVVYLGSDTTLDLGLFRDADDLWV